MVMVPGRRQSMRAVVALLLFVVGLLIIVPGTAFALCDEYIKETDSSFSVTEICSSSLKQPKYQIVRHYFDDGESLIFSFAPRSRKLLCHRYEVAGQSYDNCDSYGVNFFPKELSSGDIKVRIKQIDDLKTADLTLLFDSKNIFQTPDLPDLVPIEGCMLTLTNDQVLVIGYYEQRLIELSNCLVNFEGFLGTNAVAVRNTNFQ